MSEVQFNEFSMMKKPFMKVIPETDLKCLRIIMLSVSQETTLKRISFSASSLTKLEIKKQIFKISFLRFLVRMMS